MSIQLVDCHIHLDLYKDPFTILDSAQKSNISLVAVTNAPFLFEPCKKLTSQRKNCWTALGMHPELVPQYGKQLQLFKELLCSTIFVGEIGLDYISENNKDRQVSQRIIFEEIINYCSQEGNKILSIHSRGAAADVISIIGHNFPGKIIMHWFSGTTAQLEQAIDAGFYFSINTAMINSKNGKNIISRIPIDRILLESDGPFIQINARDVTSNDISLIVEALAEMRKTDYHETCKTISKNFDKITKSQ